MRYVLAAAAASLLLAVPAQASPASKKFQAHVWKYHPCLARIIGMEGFWDPTIDLGGGHGNVYEPYGIGQANPGTKMAAYGADWRTNPWTQLRWMVAYTTGRYGSECAALDYRLRYGYY